MPDGTSRGKGSAGGGGKGNKGGGGGGKGGKGSGTAGDGPTWDCHICGLPGNFGWRLRCRGCEAIRRRNGGGGVIPSPAAAASRDTHQPSLAERQVRQMREAHRKQRQADEEEKKQLKEALSRLREESIGKRKAKGQLEDDGDLEGEGDDGDVPANEFSSWTEEERQKKLEEARGGLAYLVGKYGEDSEEANATRGEISSLQRASRDAKPFKAHRGLLERRRERLKEKQQRDEAEVARIKSEVEDLEAKKKTLQSTIEDRNKQLVQVEEELAELVRRALAEGEAAGEAGRGEEDGQTAWAPQSAAAVLQSLASKQGVPPEFAALLAHVAQAAQAIANAAAAGGQTAGTKAAEGGDGGSHRGGQQQRQQQPQQQEQPPHPAAAATTTTTTETGGKGNLSSVAATPLAPQGRWAKGAGSSTNVNGNRGGDDDMQVDAGPAGDQTNGGAKGDHEEHDPELLEEEAVGANIDESVAESISKLPTADQERLRAALGARGGRRRNTEVGQGEGTSGGRDRERSPRPTKGGINQNDE
jgi:hypothetical protein